MVFFNRFFNLKNLLFVIAVLVISIFAFSRIKSTDHLPTDEYLKYEVSHPFPIHATNLLERANENDGDFSSRLNKYDVKAILDEVLIEQGLHMTEDTLLTIENIAFPITAFDPTDKIGYVWLDNDRFGEGILDNALGFNKPQKLWETEFLKGIDDGLELFIDNEEIFLRDIFGSEDHEVISEKEKAESEWKLTMDSLSKGLVKFKDVSHRYQAYSKYFGIKSSILDHWDFFGETLKTNPDFVKMFGKEVKLKLQSLNSLESKREYIEVMLKEFRKVLEVNNLSAKPRKTMLDEWKLSAAEMIKEPVRFFGFISRVDHLRIHSPNNKLLTALNDQIYEITLYKSKKDWWKHSEAIIELFNVNKNLGLSSQESYHNLLSEIMTKAKYPKWKNRYSEIEAFVNVESISLSELKSLDFLAFQRGIFIAPISILDNRMIYNMEENLYQEELEEIRKQITLADDKKMRKKLQEKLVNLTTYRSTNYANIRRKAKEKSLEIIKNDFRKYIIWAKEESKNRLVDSGL